MPLTKEQVDALLAGTLKPKAPQLRQTRIRTQFPELPKGGPVTWHDTYSPNKSLRCASRGCGASTVYKLRGIPKCSPHLIIELVLELLSRPEVKNEGSSGYADYKRIDIGVVRPSVTTEGLL